MPLSGIDSVLSLGSLTFQILFFVFSWRTISDYKTKKMSILFGCLIVAIQMAIIAIFWELISGFSIIISLILILFFTVHASQINYEKPIKSPSKINLIITIALIANFVIYIFYCLHIHSSKQDRIRHPTYIVKWTLRDVGKKVWEHYKSHSHNPHPSELELDTNRLKLNKQPANWLEFNAQAICVYNGYDKFTGDSKKILFMQKPSELGNKFGYYAVYEDGHVGRVPNDEVFRIWIQALVLSFVHK